MTSRQQSVRARNADGLYPQLHVQCQLHKCCFEWCDVWCLRHSLQCLAQWQNGRRTVHAVIPLEKHQIQSLGHISSHRIVSDQCIPSVRPAGMHRELSQTDVYIPYLLPSCLFADMLSNFHGTCTAQSPLAYRMRPYPCYPPAGFQRCVRAFRGQHPLLHR